MNRRPIALASLALLSVVTTPGCIVTEELDLGIVTTTESVWLEPYDWLEPTRRVETLTLEARTDLAPDGRERVLVVVATADGARRVHPESSRTQLIYNPFIDVFVEPLVGVLDLVLIPVLPFVSSAWAKDLGYAGAMLLAAVPLLQLQEELTCPLPPGILGPFRTDLLAGLDRWEPERFPLAGEPVLLFDPVRGRVVDERPTDWRGEARFPLDDYLRHRTDPDTPFEVRVRDASVRVGTRPARP